MANHFVPDVGEQLDLIGRRGAPVGPPPTIGFVTICERTFGRCLEDFQGGVIYRYWPSEAITEMVWKRATTPGRQRPCGEGIWAGPERT